MNHRFAGLLMLAMVCGNAHAGSDCALGQRYVQLAQDRLAAFAQEEALDFLRQATAVCASYETYQQLGELAAQSAEREQQVEAVRAFVQAHAWAGSDDKRARALYHYARLLSAQNDPQNAYPLAKWAQQLEQSNAEIAALAAQLEEQVRNPRTEQLVRGLRDSLYQPLTFTVRSPPNADRGRRSVAVLGAGKPSINIQINFIADSTEVDAQTRPNVATLARALADASLAGSRFVLVGHADVRGTDAHNMELSKRRSEALSQAIVQLEPSLSGRVDTVGRGELEPLDLSLTASAHRTNRRLQVLLQ